MKVDRLLHFVRTNARDHFIFKGSNGELYQVGDKIYWLLFSTYNQILAKDDDIEILSSFKKMLERLPGIESNLAEEIVFTEDFPPMLKNELVDTYFYENLNKFSGFYVFPTYMCNLNCTYCTYSGLYPKERQHMPISMSSDLIDDAVVYIRRSISESRRIDIVFYGDEPLVNFRGIRRMIEALERDNDKIDSKILAFQIVTNGLLLNEHIIDFIIKRRVKMQISIDGPSYIHDRYRKTLDGHPTHDDVINKLEQIREIDRNYYEKYVGISCTLAPPFFLEAVDSYFRNDSLFSHFSGHRGNFSISIMNMEGTNFYREEDISAFREQMKPFKEAFMKYLLTGDKVETQFISSAMYEAPFYAFARKCLETRDKWIHPGECIPGIGGAAIGADGNIFVCNTFNLNSIGTIQKGISIEKARELRQAYLSVRNAFCRDCWIFRFCPVCIAAFKYAEIEQNQFDPIDCKYVKAMIEDLLKIYIFIATEAPHRLKEFLDR